MATTETIILLTGDYPTRLNKLYAAAQAASSDDSELLNGEEHPYETLQREYEELKAEAESEGKRVVVQSLSRKAWRDLREKHPPRTEGDEGAIKADRAARLNTETVEDDLVYASVIEPKFSSRGAFDEWVDQELSEGEFNQILLRAWKLANVPAFDPKSLPSSPTRSDVES